MKTLKELLERCSIKAIDRRIASEVAEFSTDYVLPSMKMVEACRAEDFGFFQPFIDASRLTVEQMHHAAEHYYLGKTRSGRPIFWMIDDTLDPQDARIVGFDSSDTWISTLLKAREPFIQYWCPTHCLFGLHQLSTDSKLSTLNSQLSKPVAIVESEQNAVILSELFPEYIWMAYVTVAHLQVELFAPLEGRTVTLFPCTDPGMSNYIFFDDLATAVRKRYPSINISVDSTLEDNATDEQKSRCIDLVDFLLESLQQST